MEGSLTALADPQAERDRRASLLQREEPHLLPTVVDLAAASTLDNETESRTAGAAPGKSGAGHVVEAFRPRSRTTSRAMAARRATGGDGAARVTRYRGIPS